MTPEIQIPSEIRQMLARAKPEQIARLLRDMQAQTQTKTQAQSKRGERQDA